MERLLTPEECATILGVRPSTLAVWRSTGRYEFKYVRVGRLIKYPISSVEAFIEARSRLHT